MQLSKNLKKLIIWSTGYLSLIAFILTGGYFYFNDDDSEIKATVKEVTYFSLVFFIIGLCNELSTNFIYIANLDNTGFNIYLKILGILKILVFITLVILDLLGINLIHTPIGVRIHTNNVVIPTISEDEEETEEEFSDEDGNVYESNIFGTENIE